ncbi:MAG TPA: tetratricopeptide repeat protein, partial [Kofleriaceae bacterium]|nr:tetratricopeptide repeat protein [Kofleriaceae bacterium]
MRHLVCVLLLVLSSTAEAQSKAKPKAKPAAAKSAKQATKQVAKQVDAATAKQLGAAYRAYDDNDLAGAKKHLAKIDDGKVIALDYLLWLRGMVALRSGDAAAAKTAFEKLAKVSPSSFGAQVPWRLADCAWELGDRAGAAKAYAKLINSDSAGDIGDVGTAKFRIAEATPTAQGYRVVVLDHPGHPLAARAEQRMLELGGAPLDANDHLTRAKQLSTAHLWDQAIAELALIPQTGIPEALANQRDYWTGETLFSMRRRYGDAAKLLLAVYAKLDSPQAMFHGARALSRADQDDDAIVWYGKVVATYPRTPWAEEAAFLIGWLDFNRGKYKEAIKPLETSLAKYPRSKWVDDATWFLGMAHYFLGEWDAARERLAALAKYSGSLEGGKGTYWLARIDERLKKNDAAIAGYRTTVEKHPFSWYSLLARSRLAALGVKVGPFGTDNPKPQGPALAATVDAKLANDELILRSDELTAAGLGADAGDELARNEKAFLKRNDRAAAFAMLLDRYRKAGNF